MQQVQNKLKYFVFLVLFSPALWASNSINLSFSGGEITGKIVDSESNEPLPFATILLESNGFTDQAFSDDNGFYTLKPIPSGKYTLKCYYLNYHTVAITDIVVESNRTINIDVEMEIVMGEEVVVIAERSYVIPLIDISNAEVGLGLASGDLEKMPFREPSQMASLATGVTQSDRGEIQIRGGRVGTTAYYIDGMRVNSINAVPAIAIDQMQVITGGIPAKYGDTTGGVVVITTKGFRSR